MSAAEQIVEDDVITVLGVVLRERVSATKGIRYWSNDSYAPIALSLHQHRPGCYSLGVEHNVRRTPDEARGTVQHTIWDATSPEQAEHQWLASAARWCAPLCAMVVDGMAVTP